MLSSLCRGILLSEIVFSQNQNIDSKICRCGSLLDKNFCDSNFFVILMYFENKYQICLFPKIFFYLKSNLSGFLNIVLYKFMLHDTFKKF